MLMQRQQQQQQRWQQHRQRSHRLLQSPWMWTCHWHDSSRQIARTLHRCRQQTVHGSQLLAVAAKRLRIPALPHRRRPLQPKLQAAPARQLAARQSSTAAAPRVRQPLQGKWPPAASSCRLRQLQAAQRTLQGRPILRLLSCSASWAAL